MKLFGMEVIKCKDDKEIKKAIRYCLKNKTGLILYSEDGMKYISYKDMVQELCNETTT